MLSRNGVEAKHLKFFVAEFILRAMNRARRVPQNDLELYMDWKIGFCR
jgi:hypothetical protein